MPIAAVGGGEMAYEDAGQGETNARVNPPVVALAGLGKDRQPRHTVSVVTVDVLTTVAARSYVIQAASQFETKWARHGGILLDSVMGYKT